MELLKLYFRRRAGGEPAIVPVPEGGATMQKVLVPVGGSRGCDTVVQYVIREFMNNTAMEVHLLNVQPPLRTDVSRFVSKRNREGFHHEESEKALRACREKLDRFGVPYAVHMEVGDPARCITETARRLHCDHILLGTARMNSLTRLIEDSITNKVLELSSVPVEVIPGNTVSRWERYGVPAAIAALAALFLAAVD
jgi:nucleotide-binding universal stress UspA family protein